MGHSGPCWAATEVLQNIFQLQEENKQVSQIKGHVDLTVLTGHLDVLLYTLRVANLPYTSHEWTDRSTHPC